MATYIKDGSSFAALLQSYRPPQITQYGIDRTLDECRVVAMLHGVADATLGESTKNRYGQEKSLAAFHKMARQARDTLADDRQVGGLNTTNTRQMVTRFFGLPDPGVINITKKAMLSDLRGRRRGFSVSGNPSDIVGASDLKRCACNHEWYLSRASSSHILVYDGLRRGGIRLGKSRGEWIPIKQVMQMTFGRKGYLDGVIPFPIGGWTRERRTMKRLRVEKIVLKATVQDLKAAIDRYSNTLDRRDTRIRDLEVEVAFQAQELEVTDSAKAAGREQALVRGISSLEALRTVSEW